MTDDFLQERQIIEQELEGLKQGNQAERELKHSLLTSKLAYYQLITNTALVSAIDNASKEVNHLKQSLANNIKETNKTSEKLSKGQDKLTIALIVVALLQVAIMGLDLLEKTFSNTPSESIQKSKVLKPAINKIDRLDEKSDLDLKNKDVQINLKPIPKKDVTP